MSNGRLFDGDPIDAWLRERQTRCEAELTQIPIEHVIAQPLAALSTTLLEQFRVEPLVLRPDDQYADDVRETKVWGAGGLATARVRINTGTGAPGFSSAVHVPFSGEPALLWMSLPVRAGLTPAARADGNELIFAFEWPRDQSPLTREQITDLLESIQSPYLETQARIVQEFNDNLHELAREQLTERRDGFLRARELLDGLRIPIYRRGDAPQTYAAPGIARRPAPDASATSPGQALEPVLVEEFYRHIVSVSEAMARGMERNPGDYANWSEEQLRDALLVILNTHYQGQATGETFNKNGKTDILIRYDDRNLFIGECKWWSGAKAFAESETAEKSGLDQLLSYTTWRDAKLALAVFVDRQNIDAVISSARTAIAVHPSFIAWRHSSPDGSLRARVKLLGEGDRAADLAVVFVHLPRPAPADSHGDQTP